MTCAHDQRASDRAFAAALVEAAPTEARAFLAFKHAAERDDGALPPHTRELISLAVALTTQCAYCIEVHVAAARTAGATRAEIAETVFIAAALGAGAAVGHGLLAMRLFSS